MPTIDINSNVPRLQFTANAAQTEFSLNFIVFANADLIVVVDGVTQTLTTHYAVSDLNDEDGATVTFVTPMTGGELVTIYRRSVISRQSQYQQDGRFDAEPLERDLDKITTYLQEQARDLARALVLDPDDTASSITLPISSPGSALGWSAPGVLANLSYSDVGGSLDATFTDLTSNDVIQYDGTNWINIALSSLGFAELVSDNTLTGNNTFTGTVTLPNDTVTNAQLANVPTSTIKGRLTAGTGDPEDLNATQARDVLDVYSKAESDALSAITSATVQTSTGVETAFDFTSIPAETKRIVIQFEDISLSGSDNILVQLGDSGGIEATGYDSASTIAATGVLTISATSGFPIYNFAAADAWNGLLIITRKDSTNNTWIASGVFSAPNVPRLCISAGSKSLSAELDRVRVTRSGANSFDFGSLNITYE